MALIKVGVLRGGPSQEHEVSLKTGKAVLANLPSHKYIGEDILITPKGEWIFNGQFSNSEKVFRSVDVIFNALHGEYGEDGKVQQILEAHSVPYTGSGILASAIGMNKIMARDVFFRAGLGVPRAVILDKKDLSDGENIVKKIFQTMHPPWVIKPACSGSSVGMTIARHFCDLERGIKTAFNFDNRVIIEEYIQGREVTCGIIDKFRGQKHYALPVTEIIPDKRHDFFNYEAKYNGTSREVCPANFAPDIKTKIEQMARLAHDVTGCRHYSRSDFIVSDKKGKHKGKIYILEINTLPGMTGESLMPKALEAVGSGYADFLDHLIGLALSDK